MTINDTDPLEEQFAMLLVEGAKALAEGSPWYPENNPAVPAQLLPRLQGAQRCLQLLDALWQHDPPESKNGPTLLDPEAPAAQGNKATRIGPFEILGELGRGGMGVVYKAWQPNLKRVVALKTILAGMLAGPQLRERFNREAEMAASLRHPHLVQIYEIGVHEDCPYFVQEFMDGGNLAKQIVGRVLSPNEATEIVETLARAIHYAHESGIVHRDLKPSNILLQPRIGARRSAASKLNDIQEPATGTLSQNYFLKVADFGLAREQDADATRTGQILGTPRYMAPEQAEGNGKEVGPPADIYGLGVILYELLTGKPPFMGKTTEETLRQVKYVDPKPPRQLRREISRDLQDVCLKSLEKSPGRRYPSAKALADDLGRCLKNERPLGTSKWTSRLRRGFRRYSAALICVPLLVAALAGALYLDPGRPLRELEKKLAAGPVTLIGETGPPVYQRFIRGANTSQVAPTLDGAWGIHTWSECCIVELLPDPLRDRFSFSVQVRHEQSDFHGTVGIYIGRTVCPRLPRDDHMMVILDYNDLRSPAKSIKVIPAQALAKHPPRNENLVFLNPWYMGQMANGLDFSYRLPGEVGPKFLPAGDMDQRKYRLLEIVVTPDEVKGYWDGQEVKALTTARYISSLLKHQNLMLRASPEDGFLAQIPVTFNPRGGLGLFAQFGSAWFKDAVITPLTEAE